jgi:hypothetical protein
VIPIYQRTYSWGERECRQLWDDILRTGRSDAVSAHFVGSIVYVEKGLYSVSSQSPLLVIDGQATDHGVADHERWQEVGRQIEPVDGFSQETAQPTCSTRGWDEYKLLLTQTDKQTMLSLLNKALPDMLAVAEEAVLRGTGGNAWEQS